MSLQWLDRLVGRAHSRTVSRPQRRRRLAFERLEAKQLCAADFQVTPVLSESSSMGAACVAEQAVGSAEDWLFAESDTASLDKSGRAASYGPVAYSSSSYGGSSYGGTGYGGTGYGGSGYGGCGNISWTLAYGGALVIQGTPCDDTINVASTSYGSEHWLTVNGTLAARAAEVSSVYAYGHNGHDNINLSGISSSAAMTWSVVYGGAGNDNITGSFANDSLYGEDGVDTIMGRAGSDWIYGGQGDDSLYADDTAGSASTGSGGDHLYGQGGNDYLFGSSNNDSLEGGDGNDSIYGNAGADSLLGGTGIDYLAGGSGNDTLNGGSEVDSFGDTTGDFVVDRPTIQNFVATAGSSANVWILSGTVSDDTSPAGRYVSFWGLATGSIVVGYNNQFSGSVQLAGNLHGDLIVNFTDAEGLVSSAVYYPI